MVYSYSAYIIVDVTLSEVVSGCAVAVVFVLCGGTNVEGSGIEKGRRNALGDVICYLINAPCKLGTVPCDTG
jgi:hypothetical protein